MTATLPYGALRAQAEALARAAAWPELATLLAVHEHEGVREVADLMTLRAESLILTGQPREARHWLAETMPTLARKGERHAFRRATNMLGGAHFALGELDAAQAAFERALELGQQDRDDLTMARATNNLATIANIRGEYEQALTLYQLAIPSYQRLGNVLGLAQSFHNMAITYRDLAQLGRADDCERRAIEYARQAGSSRLQAHAQLGRADVSLRLGDALLAEAGARLAAKTFVTLGDPINEADARRLVGMALLAQNRFDAAEQALNEALSASRAHGSALQEAEALRALADLCLQRAQLAEARRLGERALEIFSRLDAKGESEGLRRWIDQLGVVPANGDQHSQNFPE